MPSMKRVGAGVVILCVSVLPQLCSAQSSAQTTAFSLTELRNILSENAIKSIDELIVKLPAAYREKPLLPVVKRGLQTATKSQPRIIAWERASNLVMAFVGKGTSNEFSEFWNFDEVSGRFTFGLIQKNPNSGNFFINESSKVQRICTECHRSILKPVWDPYLIWSTMYGSADHGANLQVQQGAVWPEFELLDNFAKNEGSRGRYALFGSGKPYQFYSQVRNNTDFSYLIQDVFSKHLAARIESRLIERPDLIAAVLVIVFRTMDLENKIQLYLSGIESHPSKSDFETHYAHVQKIQMQSIEARKDLHIKTMGAESIADPLGYKGDIQETAFLKHVAYLDLIGQKYLGLDADTWTTSFVKNSYLIQQPAGDPLQRYRFPLFYRLKQWPILKDIFEDFRYPPDPGEMAKLLPEIYKRTKSLSKSKLLRSRFFRERHCAVSSLSDF